MKINLKSKCGIFPQPVLLIATYNDDNTVNVMNAAWGTMVDSDIIALNLTETHKTVQNIKKRGAFTVSIATADKVVEADYFGIASGKKVSDKLSKAKMTATKSQFVDAPVINELPVCMECTFIEFQDDDYGLGVIGKIVNLCADESVIKDGKVDISLLNAIAYDTFTHGYYKIGERVGEAFADGNKIN